MTMVKHFQATFTQSILFSICEPKLVQNIKEIQIVLLHYLSVFGEKNCCKQNWGCHQKFYLAGFFAMVTRSLTSFFSHRKIFKSHIGFSNSAICTIG